ncbi:MAG: two-component system, OmpR family, sensor histidine kinase MprB [Solirubrobacteraceae bacterium]|nr:two-component system, OmpR family, sensor histidine kinase MprB [Solirubrobacteraceae bacterium]MEA2358537.1 two-component system, OmpR family, sensor histidine kinase MprB [Solirubrobacteraceae bacterium]
MIRRRGFGLRPRLLAALVLTSVVTLVAAALALLPPLQDRLRRQSVENLQAAVLSSRSSFQDAVVSPSDVRPSKVLDQAQALRTRTDSRVVVTRGYPVPSVIIDTDFAARTPQAMAYRTLRLGGVQRAVTGDVATVAVRLFNRSQQPVGTLIATKQLTDVSAAVEQVRNAFLTAAGVGLLVAFLIGIALATTLGRRLARLRDSAIRVTEEGTDAPEPRDDGSDEVGDLARALATMQRELRRQETARRSFVATASHELRTPLTSLQGTLELLQEDLHDGRLDYADAERQVARAQVELRRLGRLAGELLDLSRLDAVVPLREEPVELAELCRAVAAEFELRAREEDVALDVATPPGPCWGRGDPGAVARVVRILLDNALRYAPASSTVRVLPAYHGERATVEIADEGLGVPVEDRERIFERFERGSAASGESGFGLGLAIGRELARRMGGELRLDDGRPTGARFVLGLPIELPSGSHHEPHPAPTAG